MKTLEAQSGLIRRIGSTGSGTGAAIAARINREASLLFAKNISELEPFIGNVPKILRNALARQERIIIEGTQGFGLSPLHARLYPYVTSRDTTAAAFVSETGLSPLDVDDVILTIRSFPIRVAGNSGPFPLPDDEIDWETITSEGGHELPIEEKTTVTKLVRRVARFNPKIVRQAIAINSPTRIVLNHLDYICSVDSEDSDQRVKGFVDQVKKSIEKPINYLGFGPKSIEERVNHFRG